MRESVKEIKELTPEEVKQSLVGCTLIKSPLPPSFPMETKPANADDKSA